MWTALVLGALAVLLAVGMLLKNRLGKSLLVLSTIAVLVIGVGTAVCWSVPDCAEADYDYAVLLGALLEDGKPTPELERRMNLALEWQKTDEKTVLFVSGGEPDGQGITEARVMYDWLEAHGADMDRIVMEDQAEDTRQNILYSKDLAQQMNLQTNRVLLLTSEYHQTRAGFLARRLGQQPVHLSCETPFGRHLDASFREVFAFIKAFLETL